MRRYTVILGGAALKTQATRRSSGQGAGVDFIRSSFMMTTTASRCSSSALCYSASSRRGGLVRYRTLRTRRLRRPSFRR